MTHAAKDLHEEIREDAKRLLKEIQDKNVEYDPDRKVRCHAQRIITSPPYRLLTPMQLSIVVEFVAGKVTETIERMIALYRPDALVVGTRGQGGIRTWGAALTGGIGSVSKYVVACPAFLLARADSTRPH